MRHIVVFFPLLVNLAGVIGSFFYTPLILIAGVPWLWVFLLSLRQLPRHFVALEEANYQLIKRYYMFLSQPVASLVIGSSAASMCYLGPVAAVIALLRDQWVWGAFDSILFVFIGSTLTAKLSPIVHLRELKKQYLAKGNEALFLQATTELSCLASVLETVNPAAARAMLTIEDHSPWYGLHPGGRHAGY